MDRTCRIPVENLKYCYWSHYLFNNTLIGLWSITLTMLCLLYYHITHESIYAVVYFSPPIISIDRCNSGSYNTGFAKAWVTIHTLFMILSLSIFWEYVLLLCNYIPSKIIQEKWCRLLPKSINRIWPTYLERYDITIIQ